MPTLRDVGEFEVIRRLIGARHRAPGESAPARSRSGVIVGSGDDAAVLRPAPGHDIVATTDSFVEGRHYVPAFFTPREVGARLATANLSDMAAMAAVPRWALLSIGARREHDLDALIELQAGLEDMLASEGACLVGGNLVAVNDAEWLSLMLLGEAPPARVSRRRGATAGDLLAVTGSPGRAGTGALLGARLGERALSSQWQSLLDAWVRPKARVHLALELAKTGSVRAAIDVSDGVASDLGHLCEASGVGAEIARAAWPADPSIAQAAQALGIEVDHLSFGPSDDYELLLAVAASGRVDCQEIARAMGVPLAFVGRFTEGVSDLALIEADGRRTTLSAPGYDHFAESS